MLNTISSLFSGIQTDLLMTIIAASFFFILLITFIIVYIVKYVHPLMPYLYPIVIVQSRNKNILTKDKAIELAKSKNITEFKKKLIPLINVNEQSQVKSNKDNSIIEIEQLIIHNFITSIDEIKSLCPKSMVSLIDNYNMLLETNTIKTLYNIKEKKLAKNYISNISINKITPIGQITNDIITKVVNVKNETEFISIFKHTNYKSLFQKHFQSYEDFENELELFIIKKIENTIINKTFPDKKIIHSIMQQKIDLHNIKLLTVFLTTSIEPRLIEKGTLNIKDLKKIKSFEDMSKFLESTIYDKIFTKTYQTYKKTNSTFIFETSFQNYMSTYLDKHSISHFQSPVTIISYIMKREFEYHNLIIALHSSNQTINLTNAQEMMIQ